MPLGSNQPLSEMNTRNISWGIKAAGAWGWQPYHLHVPIVLKSGSLNLLEPSGPVHVCTGIAVPYLLSQSFDLPLLFTILRILQAHLSSDLRDIGHRKLRYQGAHCHPTATNINRDTHRNTIVQLPSASSSSYIASTYNVSPSISLQFPTDNNEINFSCDKRFRLVEAREGWRWIRAGEENWGGHPRQTYESFPWPR